MELTERQEGQWTKLIDKYDEKLDGLASTTLVELGMLHIYGNTDPTDADRECWAAAEDRAKRFGGVAIRIPIDPWDGFLRPTVITKDWDKWMQDVKQVLEVQLQLAKTIAKGNFPASEVYRNIQAKQFELLAKRTQIHDMRDTVNEADCSYISQLHAYLPKIPLTPMDF